MRANKCIGSTIVVIAVIMLLLTMTGRTTYAQSSGDSNTVLAKLQEVLNNQKQIMAELASLKEDVRIVKIRVTQSQ